MESTGLSNPLLHTVRRLKCVECIIKTFPFFFFFKCPQFDDKKWKATSR